MTEQKERFKLYDIADLQALPKPQQAFVIDPIVPYPGVTLLHGRWGTGKTAILMTQAIAVASGKPFLDCAVKQGPVLIIEADMPDPGFRHRFYDLHQQLDPKLPIKVLTTPGFDALNPMFKGDPLGQRLLDINTKFKPIYVIVDTLRKTHRRDERESSTSAEVYQYWMDTFPDSAVQILAHDRKVAMMQHGAKGTPDEENFSGHQGWLNDAQSAVHVVPSGPVVDGKHAQLRIVHTKSQVGECNGKPWDVRILDGGVGIELIADTVMRTVEEIVKRMEALNATEDQINEAIAQTLNVSKRTAGAKKASYRQREATCQQASTCQTP